MLIGGLFGAWFLLRSANNEFAQSGKNQDAVPPNVNSIINSPAPNSSPETSPLPAENLPKNETLYALTTGS